MNFIHDTAAMPLVVPQSILDPGRGVLEESWEYIQVWFPSLASLCSCKQWKVLA